MFVGHEFQLQGSLWVIFLKLRIQGKETQNIYFPYLCTLTPAKKTAKSANFSVTKEDDVYQYVVRNPLNKEGMKPRTIVHKIQYFVAPCALQHRYWHNTLKKEYKEKEKYSKENKEEATRILWTFDQEKEASQRKTGTDCPEMEAVLPEGPYL